MSTPEFTTLTPYLSMLSSQVSPTRSSSESDCRWDRKSEFGGAAAICSGSLPR